MAGGRHSRTLECSESREKGTAWMGKIRVQVRSVRLVVLVTDAFGGRGGIAQFNRDLLGALTSRDASLEVVALPRIVLDQPSGIPPGVHFDVSGATGKASYITRVLQTAGTLRFDGVICGHVNLAPLAAATAMLRRVPLLLITHGIEAWRPIPGSLRRQALRRVNAFVSVSNYTRNRFLSWAPVRHDVGYVIPNCVDLSRFTPGLKRHELLNKYGLHGKKVLLTVARL